jgi:hypothetical protein
MITKENSHYHQSRPCGIRTKNGGQLRDLVSKPVSSDGHLRKVKTTRIRQPLVQWQVKAGLVIANLNIMER